MQTKSLTTALTAMLLISAVPMVASSKATCSVGSCVDTTAKVGGVLAAGYATYALSSLAVRWYRKTPCALAATNARVEALEKGQAKLAENQGFVMGTVFGSEGLAVARHHKSKHGLYGAANHSDDGEFSSSYRSAVDAAAKADADKKAAIEKDRKENKEKADTTATASAAAPATPTVKQLTAQHEAAVAAAAGTATASTTAPANK